MFERIMFGLMSDKHRQAALLEALKELEAARAKKTNTQDSDLLDSISRRSRELAELDQDQLSLLTKLAKKLGGATPKLQMEFWLKVIVKACVAIQNAPSREADLSEVKRWLSQSGMQ